MHFQKKQPPAPSIWSMLFLPEDTASPDRRHPYEGRCRGDLGCIKFWLWIAISIAVAVSIGQL